MDLVVTGQPGATDATLSWGTDAAPAKVGRSGLLPDTNTPKEGDGATPQGIFGLRQVYYRPDRCPRPRTALPVIPLTPNSGWCDDPDHALYNRFVHKPFSASHEQMWKDSRVYDICIVMDFNLTHPKPGRGSAIFFHLTNNDTTPGPTEGCVAISPIAMGMLLPQLSIGSTMNISLGR